MACRMSTDADIMPVVGSLGGYLTTIYGDPQGNTLQAANAVSALGALAGVFAQIQARVMLANGDLPQTQLSLLEVGTQAGEIFYFGDAINACLIEGARNRPSFWNLAAAAARDPAVDQKIDVAEILERTARLVGDPGFGVPRMDKKYMPTENPIAAVRAHSLNILNRFRGFNLDGANTMRVFGTAAQGMSALAAGEYPKPKLKTPLPRLEIVRLYMEAAIPMSRIDLRPLGVGR